jgi:hypothetical protein
MLVMITSGRAGATVLGVGARHRCRRYVTAVYMFVVWKPVYLDSPQTVS